MKEKSFEEKLQYAFRSLPHDHLHVITYADIENSTIHTGIVLYLALWSGHLMAVLPNFIAEIRKHEVIPDVYLFDADEAFFLEPGQQSTLCDFFSGPGNAPHGYGEIVWIVNQRITARDVLFETPSDTIKARLAMLSAHNSR